MKYSQEELEKSFLAKMLEEKTPEELGKEIQRRQEVKEKIKNLTLLKEKLFLKMCNKCKKVRYLNEFSKDKTKLSGYHSICKPCKNKQGIEHCSEIKENPVKIKKKRCCTCGEIKPFKEFYINRTNKKYGLQPRCIACFKNR